MRGIELEKEKALKRFSLLREYLFPNITIMQKWLDEGLAVKASYDKLAFIDLSVVEMASYALRAFISVSNAFRDNWTK